MLLRSPLLEPLKLLEIIDSQVPRKPEGAQIYQELVLHLRENRHLLVIEGLDRWKPKPVYEMDSEPLATFQATHRDILKSFLQDLQGGQTLVIVSSKVNAKEGPANTYTLESLER